jgi:FERM, RhoGEF and pleckstrin domain protein 2
MSFRVTTAAANTAEERDRWLSAVLAATKEAEAAKVTSPVLSSFGSSDEVLPEGGAASEPEAKPLASLQRSNTSVHVCWHRGASLALDDHVRAVTVSRSPPRPKFPHH